VSDFFQSEIVRESIKELELLQQQVIEKTFKTPFMSGDQRKEHVELMKALLEKQKNLYFRLSLSDDPEAIEMTQKFRETAKVLGFNESHTIVEFFSEMEKTLDRLYKLAEM
jgi:hypothetical protein